MKIFQVLFLLPVLVFACSCCNTEDCNTEEPPVAEPIYQLKTLLTERQSLHFTYNNQGEITYCEEKDTLSGNRRYSVQRDYAYNLAKGLIFSRSIYHREGEWGDNNSVLDYCDTLFLDKQQRVDSIHRHLIADDYTHQWVALWYKYDDDGRLTDLSMKVKLGTWPWGQWQKRGRLVWQDGCIQKYVPSDGQPDINYTYTDIPNNYYIDARSNLVEPDWVPLLKWFGRQPLYLQQSRVEGSTLTLFTYELQDDRIVSTTSESVNENRTETGVLSLVWE